MTQKLAIQDIDISDLKPAKYNPRTITKEEFNGLVESIKTFGLVDPIIVNKDHTIIAGHQRVEAAKSLGNTSVPCVVLNVSKDIEKRLNVTLNSQAISGKYDEIKLSELLEEFKADSNFQALRLDKLEPLDLSGSLPNDNSSDTQNSNKDSNNNTNQSNHQILLQYDPEEYEEVLTLVRAVAHHIREVGDHQVSNAQAVKYALVVYRDNFIDPNEQ